MFNKSVDGILKSVTTAIESLKIVSEIEKARADNKNDQANKLITEVGVHRDESTRANKLAAKFEDLIKV